MTISSGSAGARRGSERLKAIYTIPEEQALRFVDGDNGFIIPVARKRRLLLTALPPEGQAAYRLFYDAEAQKLLDEADGPAELKNLERIYSAYFTTAVGDNAADRLGDLYFELGRFDRAADCWLADLARTPRYRFIAGSAVGEGRPGAFPRAGAGPNSSRSSPSWPIGTTTRRSPWAGRRPRPASSFVACMSDDETVDRRRRIRRHRRRHRGSAPRGNGRSRLAIAFRRNRSKPA